MGGSRVSVTHLLGCTGLCKLLFLVHVWKEPLPSSCRGCEPASHGHMLPRGISVWPAQGFGELEDLVLKSGFLASL